MSVLTSQAIAFRQSSLFVFDGVLKLQLGTDCERNLSQLSERRSARDCELDGAASASKSAFFLLLRTELEKSAERGDCHK